MTIENNEIGYNGEHLSRLLVVNVEEELRDKDIYLEFQKPSGKKLVSSKLTLEDGRCEYYLGKDLNDENGYLKIQVVAKGENFVKKSSKYGLYISDSINASEEVNEEFEDVLIELENTKANDISYQNNVLQLLANGKKIGTPITISGGEAELPLRLQENIIDNIYYDNDIDNANTGFYQWGCLNEELRLNKNNAYYYVFSNVSYNSSGRWGVQICIDENNYEMFFRALGDNQAWSAWRRLVDNVELDSYRTTDNNNFVDITAMDQILIKRGSQELYLYPNGIAAGGGALWIDISGEAWFTNLHVGVKDNYKEVATKEDIENIEARLAALENRS